MERLAETQFDALLTIPLGQPTCAACGQKIGPVTFWRETVNVIKVIGIRTYHLGCDANPREDGTHD
jgi:hypothetical protein